MRNINSLQKHYPAAILFDICFHEPEDSNISVNTTEILKNVIDANPECVYHLLSLTV